jgi:hypothetical protein
MLMTVYECTNICSVLMRQEYVCHVLTTVQEYLLCSDEAGISWRNATLSVRQCVLRVCKNTKNLKCSLMMKQEYVLYADDGVRMHEYLFDFC